MNFGEAIRHSHDKCTEANDCVHAKEADPYLGQLKRYVELKQFQLLTLEPWEVLLSAAWTGIHIGIAWKGGPSISELADKLESMKPLLGDYHEHHVTGFIHACSLLRDMANEERQPRREEEDDDFPYIITIKLKPIHVRNMEVIKDEILEVLDGRTTGHSIEIRSAI